MVLSGVVEIECRRLTRLIGVGWNGDDGYSSSSDISSFLRVSLLSRTSEALERAREEERRKEKERKRKEGHT